MKMKAAAIAVLNVAMVGGCTGSTPEPRHPAFDGDETPTWLAYELDVPGRPPEDILPSFEASARAHGCRTEPLGHASKAVISGVIEERYGITASCDEGTLALITVEHDRVRIGCPKPTTRGQCDVLLQKIAQAR